MAGEIFWRADNNGFVLLAPKIRMERKGGSLTQVLGLTEFINFIGQNITVHKTEF